MANQQRIQENTTSRKKKVDPDESIWQERNESFEQLETNVQNLEDGIDDILADFTAAEDGTQIIGAPQAKPELRQQSSEEFVKRFTQTVGQ